MKIVFDTLPGELMDYVFILDSIANLEFYIEKVEGEEGREEKIDHELKDFAGQVRSKNLIDREKLDRYFKLRNEEDISLASFLIKSKSFWKCKTIEEYLNMVENKSAEEKKLYILEILRNDKGEEEELEEFCKSDEEILKAIKDSELHSSLKWDLFCFVQDMDKEFKDFIEFIRNSIFIYEKFKATRNQLMKKLNENLDKSINNNENALNFIKKTTRNIMNYDSFNNIYVTTSYGRGYGIEFSMKEDSLYMFLGAYYEKALKMLGGEEKDKLQSNLMIYKNLCDKNRFEILKLLTEENRYSQGDIAKILGITNATVSYHMSFLIGAKLITLDKKNKKAFYTLNKEILKESLEYIKEQLKL